MKTRIALLACFTFLVGGSLLEWPAYSQRPAAKRAKKTKGSLSFLARFSEMERRGLEPFKGVTTTDGKVAGGLFPIKSTGVSTEPVVKRRQDLPGRSFRGPAQEDDVPGRRPGMA